MISDKETLMRQAIRSSGAGQDAGEVAQENARLRDEVERLTRELDGSKADAAALADSLSFQEPMIPASHAEKVLVAVAKEAAKVGAEDMKNRFASLMTGEVEHAKARRKQAKTKDAWEYWDGRREQVEVILRIADSWESP